MKFKNRPKNASERMVLKYENHREFRDKLIFFFKKTFVFELLSKVYLFAALLNVENLNEWKERSYENPYYQKAFESMFDVL